MKLAPVTLLVLASLVPALPATAARELTPKSFGPTAYPLYLPTLVATNGGTFLTVWPLNDGSRTHLYGTLADRAGKLITPTSFLIAANIYATALTGFGSNYAAIVNSANGPQRIAEISGDGRSLRILATLPPMFAHALAFNGSNLLVVGDATEPGSSSGITVLSVIAADGRVVGPPITIPGRARYSVIADGSEFLLVSAESDAIFLRRLSSDGRELLKARVGTFTDYSTTPVVAARGDTVLIAFNNLSRIYSPLITVVATDRNGVVRSQTDFAGRGGVSLVSTAAAFLLLRRDNPNSFAQAFDRDAHPIGEPLVLGTETAAAASESLAFVAASSQTGGLTGGPIRVGADGLRAEPFNILSTTLRRQPSPRAASEAMDHLVTWLDQARESSVQAVMPVGSNGTPLQATQTDIGAAMPVRTDYWGLYPESASSVAFGRTVSLVVWKEGANIVGRRFSRGLPLEPQPFLIGAGSDAASGSGVNNVSVSDQAIAWNGDHFLVLWHSKDGLMTSTIKEQGEVRSSGKATFPDVGGPARIIWDGNRFLVSLTVYTYYPGPCHCYTTIGVAFLRLAADGTPLDSWKYPGTARIDGHIVSWHLASNGHDSLIVADDSPQVMFAISSTFRTLTAVIHTDGPTIRIEQPNAVFEWTASTASDVTWDGRSYLLAWRYGTDSLGWRIALARSFSGEVPVGRTAARAGLPDVNNAAYTPGPGVMSSPSITANTLGDLLIAVSAEAEVGNVARIRTYTEADMQPFPKPPAAPTILSSTGTTTRSVVTWKDDSGDADGFLIETVDPRTGFIRTAGTASAGQRSATVWYALLVRVRAFNLGGFSEPSATLRITDRRHAARH